VSSIEKAVGERERKPKKVQRDQEKKERRALRRDI